MTQTAGEPGDRPARPVERRRKARGSMSRDAILAGARVLVERDGLQRLSMPALARELGSGVTSIYWYFRSKDELLEALAEQVMREVHQQLPPVGSGPWEEELVSYFCAYRDLMETLPAYREVVLYAPTFLVHSSLTKPMLRRLEAGLDLLLRAGLSLDDAARTFNVCLNYTRSFVAFEHGVIAATADDGGAPPHPARTALGDDHPNLARLNDLDRMVRLDEDGFRLGFELLVAGIARRFGI